MAKKNTKAPEKPDNSLSRDAATQFYYDQMAAQMKPEMMRDPVFKSLLQMYASLCSEEDSLIVLIGDNPTYDAENRYGVQRKPKPEVSILSRIRSQKTALGMKLMPHRSKKSIDSRAGLFGKREA